MVVAHIAMDYKEEALTHLESLPGTRLRHGMRIPFMIRYEAT